MADGIATRQVPEFSAISSAALIDLLLLLLVTFWLPAIPGEPSKDALSSLLPRY